MTSFAQLLDTIHWIQWKPVFLITICLMIFQTVQVNGPSVAEKDVIATPISSKPKSVSVDRYPLTESQDSDDPLVVEGPEDHDVPPDGGPSPYIAACMAIKDQGLDLPEFFVHHYHHLGIRQFYIVDDGSVPPLSTFKYPGVPRSALTFVVKDPAMRAVGNYEQNAIYAHCMEHFGSLHTWMAFLDGDEFLETTSNDTLRDILEAFEEDEEVGALAVNWRMHTSSGVMKRPESARKAFVTCISDDMFDNQHVKVIVRTSHADSPRGPHMWNLKKGWVVGEHGDRVVSEAWRNPITRDRIALHHYAVKSREEFEEKVHRGNAMDDPKTEGFWDKIEKVFDHVECPEMAKYDP